MTEIPKKSPMTKAERAMKNKPPVGPDNNNGHDVVTLAEVVMGTVDIITDTNSQLSYIYRPNKGIFEVDLTKDEGKIKALIHKKLKEGNFRPTPTMVSQICNYIKLDTNTDITVWAKDSSNYINVKNGLLNLKTMILEKHNPAIFTTYQFNANYAPELGCDGYKEYVKTIFHPEDIIVVQELEGNILTNHYIAKKILFLYGDGDSGKSTHYRIFGFLLGETNCSNMGLDQMHKDNYVIGIVGKVANIAYEIPVGVNASDGRLLKNLTGGDSITLRALYKAPFSYISSTKLFFSGNDIPKFKVGCLDEAFVNRWRPIECPNDFSDGKDETFIDKYTTEKMLSQQLNWLIEGYQRLELQRWQLSNPIDTADLLEFFEKAIVTSFDRWLVDRIRPDVTGWVSTDDLYTDYVRWHINKGWTPKAQRSFGRKMHNQQAFRAEHTRKMIDGKQKRGFSGVQIL